MANDLFNIFTIGAGIVISAMFGIASFRELKNIGKPKRHQKPEKEGTEKDHAVAH